MSRAAIIEYYETEADGTGEVNDPGVGASTQTYNGYLDAVEEYNVDPVETQVTGSPDPYIENEAHNENSLVLELTYGETSLLLTGDAEDDQEAYLVDQYGSELRSTAMKAGHHGSTTSTGRTLLDAARPKPVVVSSSYDSQYGHPNEETLQRLAERSIPACYTRLSAEGRNERWTFSYTRASGDRTPCTWMCDHFHGFIYKKCGFTASGVMEIQSSYASTNAVQKMNEENPDTETHVDIGIDEAFEQFIESRRHEVTEKTLQAQRTAVQQFVEWLEDQDIQLSELNGFRLERFYTYEKNRGLNKTTLQQYMTSVRQFLRFLERVEAVRNGLAEKLRNPQPSKEEQRSDTEIKPERVQRILEHMDRFEYAKQHHIVMKLLWRTGIRTGTLWSLDLHDFQELDGGPVLKARHRPQQGTRLKKKQEGERIINLRDRTAQTLEDYIEHNRPSVEDEYGREPLLATENGRMSKTVIRRICYKWTCPEVTDVGTCNCDTASTRQEANNCEQSVTPHVIRSASITYWRRNDVPTEVVSDRMDVSPDIISRHYDRRTEEGKAQQRRKFLEDL